MGSAPSAIGILFIFLDVFINMQKAISITLLLSKLVREFLRKYINSELMQGYHCQIHEATGITSVLNEL